MVLPYKLCHIYTSVFCLSAKYVKENKVQFLSIIRMSFVECPAWCIRYALISGCVQCMALSHGFGVFNVFNPWVWYISFPMLVCKIR